MTDVWHLLEASLTPIGRAMGEAAKDMPQHPIQQHEGWQFLRWMIVVDEPTNGNLITKKSQGRAYISPDAMDKAFRGLAEHGYVTQSGDLFTLTNKGREAFLGYFALREQAYEDVKILSDEDFDIYINFMKKGYEAGKIADKPEHAPSSDYGYDFYSNIEGGQLGVMLGWINLFELYRDDVHVAMWKDAGFTGIQIETLTKVWNDEAHSASDISAQLSQHRGYTKADYQKALDDLVAMGYLQVDNGHYTLTVQGKALRDKIEADTDALYNAWVADTYTDDEIAEFARVVGVLI